MLSNMLTLDEFEAIRLIDAEKKPQTDAAVLMKISQPTISRILNLARKKIADALVNGKAIHIAGGDYMYAEPAYSCQSCKTTFLASEHDLPSKCPACTSTNIVQMT